MSVSLNCDLSMDIGELDLITLQACREFTTLKTEFVSLLSKVLCIETNDIFYQWLSRKISQRGEIDLNWGYFFHGYECDVRHKTDKRILRIEFGPTGRTDTFTSWGLYQFINTSCTPWIPFQYLKTILSVSKLPQKELDKIFSKLMLLGLIESPCHGITHNIPESEIVLCRRFVISTVGWERGMPHY